MPSLLQTLIHYGLHLLAPLLLARLFWPGRWLKVYLILLMTMAVDLDHLLANPIFDPMRCSICTHPLHSLWAWAVYILMIFPQRTRVVGLGLSFHLLTDLIDCLMGGLWPCA